MEIRKPNPEWYKEFKIPEDSDIKVSKKEIDKFIKEASDFGIKVNNPIEHAKKSIWLDKKRISDMKRYPGSTTREEYEKIHAQKKYCKPTKCLSTDKSIPNKQLDDINSNDAISVTYTCAGHEEKHIKYPYNKLSNPALGLIKEQTPSIIGFETRFKSDLCSALEKNIPNTKCKSEDTTMTKYGIESTKPDPKSNAKWWKDASDKLGDKRFILDNIDKKKRGQIEEFKLLNY